MCHVSVLFVRTNTRVCWEGGSRDVCGSPCVSPTDACEGQLPMHKQNPTDQSCVHQHRAEVLQGAQTLVWRSGEEGVLTVACPPPLLSSRIIRLLQLCHKCTGDLFIASPKHEPFLHIYFFCGCGGCTRGFGVWLLT